MQCKINIKNWNREIYLQILENVHNICDTLQSKILKEKFIPIIFKSNCFNEYDVLGICINGISNSIS